MKKTIATLSMMALLLGATSVFAAPSTSSVTTTAAAKKKSKHKHKHNAKPAAAKTPGK